MLVVGVVPLGRCWLLESVNQCHPRPHRQEKWREQKRERGKHNATTGAGAGEDVSEGSLVRPCGGTSGLNQSLQNSLPEWLNRWKNVDFHGAARGLESTSGR